MAVTAKVAYLFGNGFLAINVGSNTLAMTIGTTWWKKKATTYTIVDPDTAATLGVWGPVVAWLQVWEIDPAFTICRAYAPPTGAATFTVGDVIELADQPPTPTGLTSTAQ